MMEPTLKIIPLDLIDDPERPLRSDITPESVQDLVESIKMMGIIEPLVVVEKADRYRLVAGKRRLFAAGIAGKAVAPCMIVEVTGLKEEMMKIHENIARESINAGEWARHLDYLKTQYKVSNAKLAETLGMSEAWVEQHIAILKYPPNVLEAVETGVLAFSAARELVQIRDEMKREVYIRAAIRGGVTVGMAAKWRRDANVRPLAQKPQTPVDLEDSARTYHEHIETICPVCERPVAIEEAVTLTVHNQCRPKPELELDLGGACVN